MRKLLRSLAFALVALPMLAQAEEPTKSAQADAAVVETEILGDSAEGVVVRVTFRMRTDESLPPEAPLVVQGSILQQGKVLRNFRYSMREDQQGVVSFVHSIPPGETVVEGRFLVQTQESPMLLAKVTRTFTVTETGEQYIAAEEDGAEGILAEGLVPESSGAVKLLPPKRNLAPNLFVVEAQTRAPVQRVEFWVEGKKIFTKNAPPYRTELDLGALPKRVEVKVIGYDRAGRYVDADAWIVNERETPLEVKLTRTVTPDGISHFKLSVQNPKKLGIKSAELYAEDKKIFEWNGPPYALDLPSSRLEGLQFVRATVIDSSGYEASDLVFLDGTRYFEQVEVNLVELPVSVVDASGAPITDLKKEDFTVLEDKKPQKIANYAFSSDLPLSVGILVDHSGSMEPRIEQARTAAVEFFRQIITPRDRAFFGAFAWDPSSLSPFVSNVSSLAMQVADMPKAEGGTALYDAIVSGLYRFRTVEGRKALVIVTDGEDTVSRLQYEDMLRYARSARVPLYFIGIGISGLDFSASSKMKGLAAETGGVAYFVRNVDELTETYRKLEEELRTQYVVGYYTESSKTDTNYRTVDVQVNRPGAKVRTIRGFIP